MEPVSTEQLGTFVKQYPFIGKVLERRREDKANEGEIYITVKDIDPDFLFRIGDHYNGVSGEIIRSTKKRGHTTYEAGTLDETLFAVNGDDTDFWHHRYDHPDQKWLAETVKQAMTQFGDLVPVLSEKARYFVWLTVYNFFRPATGGMKSDGVHFGKYLRTELNFTVYTIPEQGLQGVIDRADPRENVELTNKLVMKGVVAQDKGNVDLMRIREAGEMLQGLAKWFQNEVYLKGLKEVVDATSCRGMSGTFDGVKMMSYVLAGSIQFTLEDGVDDFTIIGEEGSDDPRMGYNSVHATVEKAGKLVRTVADAWRAADDDTRKTLFVPDKKVGI